MSISELNTLKQMMREFADSRDWNQFHSPKNLAMALSVEAAEIVEHFQWLSETQSKNLSAEKLEKVSHELADTLLYLVRLADKLEIDLFEAACNKARINNEKYPVEKSTGNAKKYTEFI
jgi:NTP pyrophosphatase (non-canonical NTP hydrolase)